MKLQHATYAAAAHALFLQVSQTQLAAVKVEMKFQTAATAARAAARVITLLMGHQIKLAQVQPLIMETEAVQD